MSPPAAGWIAAAAIAAPFVLALPAHADPWAAWMQAVLWAIVAAVFAAAAFAARRIARLERGAALVLAFAALYLILALLDLARATRYTLSAALVDLALVFVVFYAALAAAALSLALARAVLLVAATALVAAALVRAVHAQAFASEIDGEGYRALLHTTLPEAIEFLGRFVATGWLVAAALALGAACAAAWLAPRARLPRGALAWAGTFALAAAAVAYENAGAVAARVQAYTEAYSLAREVREYRELREARERASRVPPVAQSPALAGRPQTYVFVIAESLTRNHMSVYGYWRRTTPELERLAPEAAVFSDVISPHSHTDLSLERVLTLANDANGLRFGDAANHGLIELLRAAGFTTWWISNQNTLGIWDNKTAVLSSAADHAVYLNKATGAFVTGAYDEVLLEPYAAALAHPAPRKAIFLHFLGNHWEYHRRYPPSEAAFKSTHTRREIGARFDHQGNRLTILHYDNSVHYHDKLVGQVVDRLREAGGVSAMVHFADHGENLFEGRGHHSHLPTREHVEVPLIVWLSPGYRDAMPGLFERARAAAALPVELQDLPHLVADLAGLESAVFEPARSPLSARYAPPRRRLYIGAQVYEAMNDPLLAAKRALGQFAELRPRLWAHRVNTLGKMMEAASVFAGVEIDVVHERGDLFVNHPPAEPSGLTLDEQLAYANRLNPKLSLWLDLKNLDEANGAAVLAALRRLDARHSIRGRALVETPHTGSAAAALRAAGFATSHYFGACKPDLARTLAERRFAGVSYDFAAREAVERCLGPALRRLKLRTYTWDLGPVDPGRRGDYAAHAGVLLPFPSRFADWR